MIQFTPKVKSKSQGSKDSILGATGHRQSGHMAHSNHQVLENLTASFQTRELEGGSMGPQECLLQVLNN